MIRAAIISARGGKKGKISRALAIRGLARIRIKKWTRRGTFGVPTTFSGLSVAPLTRPVQMQLTALILATARRSLAIGRNRSGTRGYFDDDASADSDVGISDEEAAEDAEAGDSDIVVSDGEAAEDAGISDANSDVVISDEEAEADWNEFLGGDEPGLVSESGVETIVDLVSDGLAVAEGAMIVEGAIDGLYDWVFGDD